MHLFVHMLNTEYLQSNRTHLGLPLFYTMLPMFIYLFILYFKQVEKQWKTNNALDWLWERKLHFNFNPFELKQNYSSPPLFWISWISWITLKLPAWRFIVHSPLKAIFRTLENDAQNFSLDCFITDVPRTCFYLQYCTSSLISVNRCTFLNFLLIQG